MDLTKLSSQELVDFIRLRGQNPGGDIISQSTQLLNTKGNVTYPILDLYIATQLAPRLTNQPKYGLYNLYRLSPETKAQFANIFGLNPNEPFLQERIIRILRFLGLINPDNTCTQISPKTNYIAISELICGRLKTNANWKNIIEAKATDPPQCSPLGFRIATSLIRIAATRIFAIPEQSILELPVNSIDSYIEQMRKMGNTELTTVGKFGLGFFSFLYWLVGHPQRYLHLQSTFQEYNGQLCSWEMIILEHNNYLIFQFGKTSGRTQTGTSITLHAEKDSINVTEFMTQIQKLKYVISVNINVNGQVINVTEKISPTINITLIPTLIQNIDFATGISLETLFNSLLVPSISTKQIQDVVLNPSANKGTMIKEALQSNNTFVLLVGNIAVVLIPFTHAYSQKYEVILQMKGITPLPVSRDDILWERPGVSEEFLANLIRLREIVLSSNPALLYVLKQALNSYVNYQSAAQNLIENFWNQTRQLLETNNIYFVPLEYVNIFHRLNNQRFIGMDEPISDNLERYLESNFQWQTNVFFGKYLMNLSNFTPRVSTAGTSRFLFIDESFVKTSQWIAEVAASLPDEYLLPISMGIGQQDNQQINNMLGNVSREIYPGAYGLVLQITGLTTYFSIDDLNKNLVDFIAGIKYVQGIDIQLTKDLIVLTRNYLRKNIPENYAYGASRPKFYVLGQETQKAKLFPLNIDRNKAISYIRNYYRDLGNLLIQERYYIIVGYLPPIIQFDKILRDTVLQNVFTLSTNIYEWLALDLLKEVTTLTPDEVNVLLEYWRTRLDNSINRNLLMLFANTRYRRDEFESKIRKPLTTILQIMRRNQQIYRSLPPAVLGNPPTQYSFTLSSLIDYVFNDPTLSFDNFLEKVPQIAAWKPRQQSSFQAIEIAINEGTTKPFIQAVMTETFQNSLDAMRLENIQGTVNVQIATVEPNSLTLLISDPVGITSAGLLALSIPFLSTKTPSEIVTGEMGSGFFNVYRESDLVRISTVKNRIQVLIEDVPIRRAGRVIDVNRRMNIGPSNQPNGTTIAMVFTPKNIYQAFTEIFYIGQNVLPLSGSTNLNGTVYNIPKQILLTSNTFEAFSMSDLEVSWIQTKGVPFREFVDYFNSTDILPSYLSIELATGFLFNVKHGGYTPVQSRTKIIIPENLKEALKNFLFNAIYLQMLQRYLTVPVSQQDHFIPNTTSQESIIQLRFNYMANYHNLSEFLLNYKFERSSSLAEVFNYMATFLGEKIPVENETKQQLNAKLTNSIIVNAAWKWLSNKNIIKPRKSTANNMVIDLTNRTLGGSTAPKTRVTIDKSKNIPTLTRFTQIFVNSFWQIGSSLGILQTNFSGNPPTVIWKSLPPGVKGQYTSNNTIELDLDRSDILIGRILQQPINAERLLALLRSQDIQDWIGVIYPASTLIHELSHAWRRTSHSAVHQPINLTISANTKLYNFEEAANVVFQEILRAGFIDRFISVWNS